MEKNILFPTVVYEWKHVLSDKNFNFISSANLEDGASVSHTKLQETIINYVEEILKDIQVETKYEIDITEMWCNVNDLGKDHPVHVHPNSIFSGIYYITDGEPTLFIDPRPAATSFQLCSRYNSILPSSQALPNKLIIFPSWLPHFVKQNTTSKVRKTISFNILLRGQYGVPGMRAETKI